MENQLAKRESNVPAYIQESMQSIEGMMKYAEMLLKSKLAPSHFYGKKKNGDTYSCEPVGHKDMSYFAGSFISYASVWNRKGTGVEGIGICVYVSAKSLEGAVKIANEKRLKELALNHWGIEVPDNPRLLWTIDKEAEYTMVSGRAFKGGSEVRFFHESVGNVVGIVEYAHTTEMFVKVKE